ncbi:MAG TPA: VapE domain-containing protein [Gaiellaceae bacterium]|nr:VapE domain-containing protein [Gaiellaceae bacterium]
MTKAPKSAREYLDALTWDGQPRIDRWLVEYAGADDTAYVRAVCRAALVAAVRRARRPGCQMDQMLVIQGPQGCEKSAALRVLAVETEWFTDDAPVSASSQQIVEATHGKWIVELSELNGMGAGDIAALKAFLSAKEDAPKRQAYQRVPERVPRSFVIVGTTSESEYLSEPTGNRRFWPVRVERFDVARLRTDRDQLWAEAAAAEAAGEAVRVPDDRADAQPDTHAKILDFLMTEWARKEHRQLVAVDLLYSPGGGYRDEEIRRWERADEPEFFAEPVNVARLVGQIIQIADGEADAKTTPTKFGKHRFVVRAHAHIGTKATMSFGVAPAYYGEHSVDGSDHHADSDVRAAYVVISDGSGVEFSSPSLDAACTYVADKLRKQADETSLINPSSYRIKRVPTA